jgi:hypothetical protein
MNTPWTPEQTARFLFESQKLTAELGARIAELEKERDDWKGNAEHLSVQITALNCWLEGCPGYGYQNRPKYNPEQGVFDLFAERDKLKDQMARLLKLLREIEGET